MGARSQDQTDGLRSLGKSGMQMVAERPLPDILEVFPNRYPDRFYIINFSFPEFTSLCPVTGQPDFGTIEIYYIPDQYCVESKSFKLYMFAFRNYQSFMETITNTILDDLVKVMNPCWIRVNGLFAPRGAVNIHVFAEKTKDLSAERNAMLEKTVQNWRMEPK